MAHTVIGVWGVGGQCAAKEKGQTKEQGQGWCVLATHHHKVKKAARNGRGGIAAGREDGPATLFVDLCENRFEREGREWRGMVKEVKN